MPQPRKTPIITCGATIKSAGASNSKIMAHLDKSTLHRRRQRRYCRLCEHLRLTGPAQQDFDWGA